MVENPGRIWKQVSRNVKFCCDFKIDDHFLGPRFQLKVVSAPCQLRLKPWCVRNKTAFTNCFIYTLLAW